MAHGECGTRKNMPITRSILRLGRNILISLITIILIFLALEGFFRIYLAKNLHYDYIGDLWVLEPNQKGFTYPNNKYATTNAEGYRGPLIDPQKPTVLFLGDSFTFGYAIGDDDTLTNNLRQELEGRNLADINIINGGVPGYGVHQMIELYDLRFAAARPKLVVVNIIEGDIFRQPPRDDPNYAKKTFVRKLIRSSSLLAFLKPRLEILRQLIAGPEELKKRNYDKFLSNDMDRLLAFHDRLKKENIALVLNAWVVNEEHRRFYDKLNDFARQHNIPMLPNYYAPVFEEYRGNPENLSAEDGHPSEIQTKRLAQVMAEDLAHLFMNTNPRLETN